MSVEAILAVLHKNVETARELIRRGRPRIPAERECACPSAAKFAIMTPAASVPPETRRAVDLLFGKYLEGGAR